MSPWKEGMWNSWIVFSTSNTLLMFHWFNGAVRAALWYIRVFISTQQERFKSDSRSFSEDRCVVDKDQIKIKKVWNCRKYTTLAKALICRAPFPPTKHKIKKLCANFNFKTHLNYQWKTWKCGGVVKKKQMSTLKQHKWKHWACFAISKHFSNF